MNIKSKNQSGFTLIEVMVALVILTTGLLGISFVHTQVYSQSASNLDNINASIVVTEVVETMRNLNISNIDGTFANAPPFENAFIMANAVPILPNALPPACSYASTNTVNQNLQLFATCMRFKTNQLLQDGVITVTNTAQTPITFSIRLTWRNRISGTMDVYESSILL